MISYNDQNLNPRQLEAVLYGKGPLLIAAGAGSGKTKTLTARIMHLLSIGVRPENILAITFTNKAAREMKSRIDAASNNQHLNSLFIGTFHSWGARFLKEEGFTLGRNKGFTIFDNDDSARLIKKILKNSSIENIKISPALLYREFSKIKNEFVVINDYDNKNPRATETIKNLFEEYEKALRLNNAFDFDDLIQKPVVLLENNSSLKKIYEFKYEYILVDEFQDTNPIQYKLISLLAMAHKNLNVVGDDAQSIYGWRGADIKNFLDFENDWPNTKIILLEENYRSTKNILSSAQKVIDQNIHQKKKTLWTSNDLGSHVVIKEHYSSLDEAEAVAESILRLKVRHENDSIAILYRTNAQSRAIETALVMRRLPYELYGGLKFYERKEVKDMIACIRYASNQDDSISKDRILDTFLKKDAQNLISNLPLKGVELNLKDLIDYVIVSTRYLDYLKKSYGNSMERIENLEALKSFAEEENDIVIFLEKISLFQAGDLLSNRRVRKNKKNEGIILSTIHTAKGLEFDHVFILGATEGILPHKMNMGDNSGLEEERRLMYVAMTRARKNLEIHYYEIGSRFLYEIDSRSSSLETKSKKRHFSYDESEQFIILD